MAHAVKARILQAQSESLAPLDFLSILVNDQLTWRSDRFVQRRVKQAEFRDSQKALDNFDMDFNKKMNRKLIYELATAASLSIATKMLFSLDRQAPGRATSPMSSNLASQLADQGLRLESEGLNRVILHPVSAPALWPVFK